MRVYCLILVFLIVGAHSVSAASLGVSKAIIQIEDLLKNGYAEESVYVSTDSSENLSLVYAFEGDVASWMSVKEKSDLYINKDHGQWITFVITPPADVANGPYGGLVRLQTSALSTDIRGRIGSTIIASFAMQVELSVTGRELISCVPGGFRIADTEEEMPLEFRFSVMNEGNVRISPVAVLEIWNRDHTEKITTLNVAGDEVLPTTALEMYDELDLALPKGQYFVEVTVPMCGGAPEEITFEVLEKGGISDRGELLRIENQYFVNVGDLTTISAFFKNVGERSVLAKFKGEVRHANTLLKVLESDELSVLPGEILPLETFFQPQEPGVYEISGRVLYNNKLTFEMQSRMEAVVVEKEGDEGLQKRRISMKSFIPVILILIAMLLLLIMIMIKKKRLRKNRIM